MIGDTDMKIGVPLLALTFSMASVVVPVLGAEGEVGRKHPVLQHGLDPARAAEYEQAVERVMAMSEEEMLAFIPDKPFTAYCECPHCYGGVEGNSIFIWSVDRPEEMTCRFCGTVFPNEKYPEDQVMTGKNRLGEEISFNYYYSREHDVRHFLTNHLRRRQREWILQQIVALGQAYQVTGKEEYARRVGRVFDRIAQVYPHYPVMQNLPRRFQFRESQDPPWPWDSGRWGYFHNEIPKEVIRAYDLVYDSQAFEALSQERGYNVRERLENEFLRATFEAVAAVKNHLSNVVGYDVAGAAMLGQVIHEPRYVHWAFGWMKANVEAGFFYDGMWHEAPSYHYMTIGGLKSCFDLVRGYTDPPGYVDEEDGTRFENLDPEKEVPFWGQCIDAPSVLDFPNGTSSPIHDTHPYEKRSPPRDRTVSTIAPGYGHASLGRGAGPHQMQAQLHFSGAYGHSHLDNLNLTLWAKEREMLPDLGYTWTQMRYWTTCTLGHNTVVVNRTDQTTSQSDGDLRWFFPDSRGVAVVEADGKRGYRNIEGLDLYRRMLVLIPVSEADAYVVDFFRVRGGTRHDWTLHGDADEDTTATCTLPLTGQRKWLLEDGEEWQEPTIEGATFNPYGMLREMARGETDGPFEVDFRYVAEPGRGLRVHVLAGGPAEVWLGRSPSVRRMGQGAFGDMRKAYDFWMPHLLVRRQAEAPLHSLFAAVHEPFEGQPFISRVERLELTPTEENAIALRVTHGKTVDTILSTLDEPPYPERSTPDGFRLQGRLGIVRQVQGQTSAAWLFEGEKLAAGGFFLDSERACYRGPVEAATRRADGAAQDAFLTEADLPEGPALHGVWMIVTHGNSFTHGYEIDRVEKQDGQTKIVLTDDHGLRIEGDKTTEVYFPRRAIAGTNTFVIPLAVTVVEGGGG